MLVTNQLQFTRHADTVVYMQDGRVEEVGTYAQLMASGGGFAKLMAQNQVRPQLPSYLYLYLRVGLREGDLKASGRLAKLIEQTQCRRPRHM